MRTSKEQDYGHRLPATSWGALKIDKRIFLKNSKQFVILVLYYRHHIFKLSSLKGNHKVAKT